VILYLQDDHPDADPAVPEFVKMKERLRKA